MQQAYTVILNANLCELAPYNAVVGFLKAFYQERVVSVVVAEYTDEVAVKFLEVCYGEGRGVVACVQYKAHFLVV